MMVLRRVAFGASADATNPGPAVLSSHLHALMIEGIEYPFCARLKKWP